MVARLFFLIFCLTYTLVAQDTKVNPVTAAELWENREIHRLRQIGFREITESDDTTKLPINAQTALKLLESQKDEICRKYSKESVPECILFLENKIKPPHRFWNLIWIGSIAQGWGSTNRIVMTRELAILNKKFTEVPTTPTAAWLQWLFPSHLEGAVIANYCHFDPIGELIQDKSGQLINQLIALLMTSTNKDNLAPDLSQFFGNFLLASGKDKDAIEHDFQEVFQTNLISQKGLPQINFSRRRITRSDRLMYLSRAKELVSIISDALEYQKESSEYPARILENSLLAYLYVRWNSLDPIARLQAVTAISCQDSIRISLMQKNRLTHYQGGIRVGSSQPFYDCAETTILNMISLSLWTDGTSTAFEQTKIRSLFGKSSKLKDIEQFFATYPTPAHLHSHQAHLDWAKLLSNLNTQHSPIKIVYAKNDSAQNKTPSTDQTYEIYGGGIENFLNVFALLMQDSILLRPWQSGEIKKMKMAFSKFSYLLSILYDQSISFRELSDPEMKLSTEKLMTLYPRILFSVHTRDLSLNIDPLHFDLLDASHLSDTTQDYEAENLLLHKNSYDNMKLTALKVGSIATIFAPLLYVSITTDNSPQKVFILTIASIFLNVSTYIIPDSKIGLVLSPLLAFVLAGPGGFSLTIAALLIYNFYRVLLNFSLGL